MTATQAAVTIYDSTLFEDNFPAGVEDHFWFKARNTLLDKTLRGLSRNGVLSEAPILLEVGCGTGIVVSGLRRFGHNISGVELGMPHHVLSPDRMRTGLKAQDLDTVQRERVEVLMFLDVIEHVPDDVEMLEETVAAFPNCRCVLVTVPARAELWSQHDIYYKHYRRYSRGSLDTTFKRAGLEPLSTRYMFKSLYAAAGCLKISGRDRDPIMHAPKNKTLHGLLASGLVLEDLCLGKLPIPGLSVLGVALISR